MWGSLRWRFFGRKKARERFFDKMVSLFDEEIFPKYFFGDAYEAVSGASEKAFIEKLRSKVRNGSASEREACVFRVYAQIACRNALELGGRELAVNIYSNLLLEAPDRHESIALWMWHRRHSMQQEKEDEIAKATRDADLGLAKS